MNLLVLPQAADEFEDAVARYEDKQAGLGRRFRDEVDQRRRRLKKEFTAKYAKYAKTAFPSSLLSRISRFKKLLSAAVLQLPLGFRISIVGANVNVSTRRDAPVARPCNPL